MPQHGGRARGSHENQIWVSRRRCVALLATPSPALPAGPRRATLPDWIKGQRRQIWICDMNPVPSRRPGRLRHILDVAGFEWLAASSPSRSPPRDSRPFPAKPSTLRACGLPCRPTEPNGPATANNGEAILSALSDTHTGRAPSQSGRIGPADWPAPCPCRPTAGSCRAAGRAPTGRAQIKTLFGHVNTGRLHPEKITHPARREPDPKQRHTTYDTRRPHASLGYVTGP